MKTPEIPLDGILRAGPNSYDLVTKLVEGKGNSSHWEKVSYFVYDTPLNAHMEYESRMDLLKKVIDKNDPFIKIIESSKCTSPEDFQLKVEESQSLGNPGVILVKPNSQYFTPYSFMKSENPRSMEVLVIREGINNKSVCFTYAINWYFYLLF